MPDLSPAPMPPSLDLGIFGGTFDPPHIGHMIIAQAACDALGLDQVLFVPAADPPHKQGISLTPSDQRWAMLDQAITDNPRFVLSDIDMARPGPHYTVDMLRIVKDRYPKRELYFVLGSDALRDFATWRDPGGIIAQARLAVVVRPGANVDLASLDAKVPGLAARSVFVDAPEIDISGTLLREWLRTNHSIRYLVPDTVEQYIAKNALYRNSDHVQEPS